MVRINQTLKIQFGIASLSVGLISLRSNEDKISFKGLSECCNKPVKMKKVCEECSKEQKWNTGVKGYEIKKGEFVVLTREELETLEKFDNGIEVIGTLKMGDIDLGYFDKPYLLEAKDNKKMYVLLNEGLSQNNKCLFVKAVEKGHEHYGIIRHDRRGLLLQHLEKTKDLTIEIPNITTSKEELTLINQLLEQKEIENFDLDNYQLVRAEQVRELIETKLNGGVIEIKERVEQEVKDTTAEMLRAMVETPITK